MQEAFGNGADATTRHASALLTHSSSKDERKSVPSARESESGGTFQVTLRTRTSMNKINTFHNHCN
jgi:hypothetical protein